MSERMVSADEAQRFLLNTRDDMTVAYYRDLCYTIVQQAEQIAVVLALHPHYSHWCANSENSQPRIYKTGEVCPVRRALGVIS